MVAGEDIEGGGTSSCCALSVVHDDESEGMIKKLVGDFVGLCRVCGPWVGLRWLASVAIALPKCVKGRNLLAGDLRMGDGPYAVRFGSIRARLAAPRVMSSIREIWVRNVYRLEELPTGMCLK